MVQVTLGWMQCRPLPEHLPLCVCHWNEVMSIWMWPGYLENLGDPWVRNGHCKCPLLSNLVRIICTYRSFPLFTWDFLWYFAGSMRNLMESSVSKFLDVLALPWLLNPTNCSQVNVVARENGCHLSKAAFAPTKECHGYQLYRYSSWHSVLLETAMERQKLNHWNSPCHRRHIPPFYVLFGQQPGSLPAVLELNHWNGI